VRARGHQQGKKSEEGIDAHGDEIGENDYADCRHPLHAAWHRRVKPSRPAALVELPRGFLEGFGQRLP
ncbi:MAG TPA: hypothetical protein DIT13_05010, partial [Verrucomicrobiales bacterium]|nr:hypothetical protein [Verrucomicrobiales bacterium]